MSSGLRINEAADDAAGASISSPMNSKNVSLRRAMRNVNDGVSLIQTADGALNEINKTLVRMRELAIQSSNGAYSNQDRSVINSEFSRMRSEVSRIASNTSYSEIPLLDNPDQSSLTIQVGIYDRMENQIHIDLNEISASQGGFVRFIFDGGYDLQCSEQPPNNRQCIE